VAKAQNVNFCLYFNAVSGSRTPLAERQIWSTNALF